MMNMDKANAVGMTLNLKNFFTKKIYFGNFFSSMLKFLKILIWQHSLFYCESNESSYFSAQCPVS